MTLLALNINTSLVERHDALNESHTDTVATFHMIATSIEHAEKVAALCLGHANAIVGKGDGETLQHPNGDARGVVRGILAVVLYKVAKGKGEKVTVGLDGQTL